MGEKIICKPKPTVAEIITSIKDEIINPPEEITITMTLKGISAKRYFFITKLLETSTGESQEEIAKFLIRHGVEREMAKIAVAMEHLSQSSTS
jgi:hypothetical protein